MSCGAEPGSSGGASGGPGRDEKDKDTDSSHRVNEPEDKEYYTPRRRNNTNRISYGSCPLYGPTLQNMQIPQKWSCNPLTYLRNCSSNTLQKWQNRLRYTLANIDWLTTPTHCTLANNSNNNIITITTMRMRVPGRSRVIWRAIQHGAQYPEDGTCPLRHCRELNSLPARQGSACNQQAVPKLCVHHGASTS